MSIWVIEWRWKKGRKWRAHVMRQGKRAAIHYANELRTRDRIREFRVVEYVRKDTKE